MPSEPMTDERERALRHYATSAAGYVGADDMWREIDRLRAALAAADALARDDVDLCRALHKSRAKCRSQCRELERLNVRLAATRWACSRSYKGQALDLADLKAENMKLRADNRAGRRWVAVGSQSEVIELSRLEQALAAAAEENGRYRAALVALIRASLDVGVLESNARERGFAAALSVALRNAESALRVSSPASDARREKT